MTQQPRISRWHRVRRPFTALTALGTMAHHGFELSSGVGLVFEPFIGRRGAIALWGVQLPGWLLGAVSSDDQRVEKLLALSNGMGLSGAVVHFIEWPWERRAGIPYLTEAEGMGAERLPAYNTILHLWFASGALAVLTETPRHARRWALVGVLLGEPLRWSAIHHFRWAREQAMADPDRWSPMLRQQGEGVGHGPGESNVNDPINEEEASR
jgi:hypothetical protein